MILQAPADFLRWDIHRAAILRMMRRDHGVKAKDVHAIEGLAGSPYGADDDREALGKLKETFAGLRHGFAAFHLYTWDGKDYQPLREPLTRPQGLVRLLGPYPPPSGVYGPHARKTASHVYQVFNADGVKLVGGSFGPDPDAALAYARAQAAAKGYPDPAVEIVTPN
ncbi:hypothetical protein CcrJ4_gp505 [Caulobacter phage J4]|nr:hypothetical protein CcrJ4_gp014 [Caulobacter phage J4]UTU09253.1 hypothetical protein CcrJ4_gp505 [Caulobacter phage J4]